MSRKWRSKERWCDDCESEICLCQKEAVREVIREMMAGADGLRHFAGNPHPDTFRSDRQYNGEEYLDDYCEDYGDDDEDD